MAENGIGAAVRRKEDGRFLTGKGRYTDDINRPGQTYAHLVRSPEAHANISGIDTAAAASAPGVVAVFAGTDMAADEIGGLPCGWGIHNKDGSPMVEPSHPPIVVERVRHVGDIVAVVIAETKAEARAAAALVEVDEVDLRRTLRATLRAGGATIPLEWRTRRLMPPTLVALCDISGSMSGYTRMLLHFLHALTNDRDRVYTFLFGTRLTNATRHLRHRDGDAALERLRHVAKDWDGGTRIGACIEEFNRSWSRRVLGQGAVVLLITDGLDREGGEGLGAAMDRLHRSCRRLIWLNPLLRYREFQPEAQGIRAILPHVDDFRPVHSLSSLRELAQVLSVPPTPARRGVGATIGRTGAEAGTGTALPG